MTGQTRFFFGEHLPKKQSISIAVSGDVNDLEFDGGPADDLAVTAGARDLAACTITQAAKGAWARSTSVHAAATARRRQPCAFVDSS